MEQANAARVLFTVLIGSISMKAGSVALAVWADVLWPGYTRRMGALYQQHPRKCVLTGLVNGVLGVFIGVALLKAGPLALLGLLLLGMLISLIVLGYGCAYAALGARLSPVDAPLARWKQLLLGGALAELAFLAPVVGQLFSVGVLFRGLGAAILALMGKGAAPASQE